MTLGEAIFLGLVQGLTEFLPVSSSGHLVIIEHYLNVRPPGLIFETLLHLGTLLAVIWVFRHDVWSIIQRPRQKMTFLIIVGAIPTGFMGILLEDFFTSLFSSVFIVGFMLLVTGIFLWLAECLASCRKNLHEMNWFDAVLIGIAQGIAITPGISRSGATVATALVRGLDKRTAAKYSFLLSIPVILGAFVLQLWNIKGVDNSQIALIPYLTGTIVATLSGYLAIKTFLGFLQRGKLRYFSLYCFLLGGLVIIMNLK